MRKTNPTPAKRSNRRTFLKYNAIGIGALATGLIMPAACTSENAQENTDLDTPESLLAKYQECLGGTFPTSVPLKAEVREVIRKDGYRIESLTYETQPGERISALLLIPDNVNADQPAPAIAVWHQHNGEYHLGKSEPAGLAGNPMHHTGVALVREGYVVLCPDAQCFEERQDSSGKLKGGDYERFEFLREIVRGRSMAWKNILDIRGAVDMLCERPEVISDKIGCYGHSMGSTHSWLAGPLEKRLKCIVGNCCLPTYEAIEQDHLLHCFPNFVPGWKKYGDTPDIAALIAPRPLHLNFGEGDRYSPVESLKRDLPRISKAYEAAGASDNFTYFIEPGQEHVLSETMWQKTKDFFKHHLKA